MGYDPTAGLGLAPSLPIPVEGLHEVLKAWSGQGRLWAALALVDDEELSERQWSERDVRRRAHRVLFARLEPRLAEWPASLQPWLEALPAESTRTRIVDNAPGAGVSWPDSAVRFGWPPSQFAIRQRSRIPDTLMLGVLRWTIETLAGVWKDAIAVEPTVDSEVRHQLTAALSLMDLDILALAASDRPSLAEIRAVRREGYPWTAVASVATELAAADGSLEELALVSVLPSPELAWRLFHLSVLGTLLRAARDAGCQIDSLRPLTATSIGPAYRLADTGGRKWDLWFEAAGACGHYGRSSIYGQMTSLLPGARPIGADLLLLLPDQVALVVECKYSADSSVVGRNGFMQAAGYSLEMRAGLAPRVTTVVIAPEGVVSRGTQVETVAGHRSYHPRCSRSALLRC